MLSSSSESSEEPWYGHYFPAQRIVTMPRDCLSSIGRRLAVDYAGQDDRSACLALIHDSADGGRDNVGQDEYKGDLASRLDILLFTSQVFAAKDSETQVLKAFIVVSPSLYARTFDSCLCQLHVFRARELHTDLGVFEQLLLLAIDFAKELKLGYTNAIVSVASCEHDLVRTLRKDGFLRVATIPNAVNISGVGFCDDIFMIKVLEAYPRQKRSAEDLNKLLSKHFPDDECKKLYDESPLPTVDFLPAHYTFAKGLAVTCRNMKKDEDGLLYEIWKSAASQGLGYGIDEVPTLTVFGISLLLNHYCVVYEEIETGKIVGFSLITESWYSRTSETKYGESSLIIAEEFRGKKLGTEAIAVELAIMKQLGYRVSVNDALASNHRMLAALKSSQVAFHSNWLSLGTIPHGCYTQGYGWDDQVITWSEIVGFPNFAQMAAESLQRHEEQKTRSKL